MRWTDTARIEAAPEVVWRLTIDVAALPSITPTMQRVDRLDDGPLRVGARTRIKQPGQGPAIWTVTEFEPGRRFVWQTRRLGMTMVGSHLIEPDGDGCRNTLLLDLTGPGSGVLGRLVGRSIGAALATENAGFKRTAENG